MAVTIVVSPSPMRLTRFGVGGPRLWLGASRICVLSIHLMVVRVLEGDLQAT